MTAKIRLPNIPRSADRDTTVFFKALKVALETLASSGADSNVGAKTKQYIQQLNKKTSQEFTAELEGSLGIGNLLDILNGSITNSQLHKDLSTRIEKITSNENAISQERLERVADILAANSAIIKERQDRVEAIELAAGLLQDNIDAESQKTDLLAAQVRGGYDGDDLSQVTTGLIYQERNARTTAIEGLAEQVSLLSAGVGEQFDSFEIWHFDKNHDGWVNGVYANGWINVRTETIDSPVIDVDGGMYRHVKLRIQKVGTPTWGAVLTYAGGSLTATEPKYDADGFAIVNFHMEWSGTITGFSIKLASTANNLNYFKIDWIAVGRPSPGASHAALLREEKARVDKDMALTQQFVSLDSQINGDGVNSSSSIVQKLETTATKANTNATDISKLSSTFNDEVMSSQGIVARNAQTAASASAANARDISGVFAQVNPRMAGDTVGWAGDDSPENLVGVWSERSARQELEFSTSEKFDAVYSRVDGNSAAISEESKTRVDAIKALSEKTDTIRADFDANAAVMQSQITAVATANTALSSRTDTIQSTVGQHTSSIQAAQSAINGINASWSIKADVNGVIGGISIANDGRTVDFIISASKFAIVGANGSSSTPFVVVPNDITVNGVLIKAGNYLENVFIRDLSATAARIGHFKSATTGARLEIQDSLLSVYDSAGTLRVRLGLW